MDSGITIYLMRHGDTGLSGRYIGLSDVAVSEKGLQELKAGSAHAKMLQPDKILVSPLLRCRQSLETLGLNGTEHVIDDLAEIDFGRWEGKSFAEVAESDPQLVEKWSAGARGFVFPDGESIAHFQKRMESVAELLKTQSCKKILLLTHGGVIRYLICLLLGLPIDNYLLFDVKPALLTEIQLFSEGGVLRRFNSSS